MRYLLCSGGAARGIALTTVGMVDTIRLRSIASVTPNGQSVSRFFGAWIGQIMAG